MSAQHRVIIYTLMGDPDLEERLTARILSGLRHFLATDTTGTVYEHSCDIIAPGVTAIVEVRIDEAGVAKLRSGFRDPRVDTRILAIKALSEVAAGCLERWFGVGCGDPDCAKCQGAERVGDPVLADPPAWLGPALRSEKGGTL